MKYRYSPIYKYILLAILYYLFLKNYKAIHSDDYFIVSLTFATMLIMLDYMVIDKHHLFVIKKIDDDILDLKENEVLQQNLDILIENN